MEKRKAASDRRGTGKAIIPRQFKRRERTFIYNRTIYLSDTNAFQNVYFANFAHFLGEAREELLSYVLGNGIEALLSSGIILLTRDMTIEYRNSLFVYDEVSVEITVKRLTVMSTTLNFVLKNKTRKNLAAEATMTIACAFNGKLSKLPPALYDRFKALFIDGTAKS